MPNLDLIKYIEKELSFKIPKETIRKALVEAGWTMQDIDIAWGTIEKPFYNFQESTNDTFGSMQSIFRKKNLYVLLISIVSIASASIFFYNFYFLSPIRVINTSLTHLSTLKYIQATSELNVNFISTSTDEKYNSNLKMEEKFDLSNGTTSSDTIFTSTIEIPDSLEDDTDTKKQVITNNGFIKNINGVIYYKSADLNENSFFASQLLNSFSHENWVDLMKSNTNPEFLDLIGINTNEYIQKIKGIDSMYVINKLKQEIENLNTCTECFKKVNDEGEKDFSHYRLNPKVFDMSINNLSTSTDNKSNQEGPKSIFEFDESIKPTEITIDLWIDAKEKLPHKILLSFIYENPLLGKMTFTDTISFNNLKDTFVIGAPQNPITIQKLITNSFISGTDSIDTRLIALSDFDHDGITNADELSIYGTDMESDDSNKNGITDNQEIYELYKKDAINVKNNIGNEKRIDTIESQILATLKYGRYTVQQSYDMEEHMSYDPYKDISSDVLKVISDSYTNRMAGKLQSSLDELNNALPVYGEYNGIIYHNIGLTYSRMNNPKEALVYYQKALDVNFESADLYYDLALENLKLDFDNKAIDYLRKGIEKYPKYYTFYVILANYYIEKNDLTKAKEIIENGLKQEPRYADFSHTLGLIYETEKNYQKAEEYYKMAISSDLHAYKAHINLSALYNDNSDSSINSLIEALMADDFINNYSNAKNALGLAFVQNGNPDRAIIEYKKAIILDPAFDKPYNNLGIAYSMKDLSALAGQSFKKAIEINPKYAKAYNNLGSVYLNEGLKSSFLNNEHLKAKPNFEKAIAIDPNFYLPYIGLGRVYLAMMGTGINYYPKAEYYFKKAIELKYDDSLSHRQLGFVYFNQGQKDEAVKEWKIAKSFGLVDLEVDQIIKNVEGDTI